MLGQPTQPNHWRRFLGPWLQYYLRGEMLRSEVEDDYSLAKLSKASTAMSPNQSSSLPWPFRSMSQLARKSLRVPLTRGAACLRGQSLWCWAVGVCCLRGIAAHSYTGLLVLPYVYTFGILRLCVVPTSISPQHQLVPNEAFIDI